MQKSCFCGGISARQNTVNDAYQVVVVVSYDHGGGSTSSNGGQVHLERPTPVGGGRALRKGYERLINDNYRYLSINIEKLPYGENIRLQRVSWTGIFSLSPPTTTFASTSPHRLRPSTLVRSLTLLQIAVFGRRFPRIFHPLFSDTAFKQTPRIIPSILADETTRSTHDAFIYSGSRAGCYCRSRAGFQGW